MGNRDVSAALGYHNATKHSYWSVRSGHGLDWPNQPLPFKIYKDVDSVRLPTDGSPIVASVAETVGAEPLAHDTESMPDLGTLARLLYLSGGITKRKPYPGGELYFRAAACTGALYHIDLYLVCGDLPGLGAGVYHFGPNDFGLVRLRDGDYRGVLAEASGHEKSIVEAPVTLVLADTHWRNAWKYGARAYRHAFWDAGTLLANTLAATSGAGVPAKVVTSFVDEEVHRLLGLEADKESVVALVPLGRASEATPAAPLPMDALTMPTEPLSPKMVEYSAIYEMHGNSSLELPEEVADMRGRTPASRSYETAGNMVQLPLEGDVRVRGLEETILRRGSTRTFAQDPISVEELSAALHFSTRGIDADFLSPYGASVNELFLIVNSVEGLASGAYRYDREQHELELLEEGDFRGEAGHLGLDQQIPADASVNVYMLSDLKPVLDAFGNRGYRMTQLESGVIGGRLYLMAYGMGFGASGLTFYDDEVIEFFGPAAEGLSVMFLVALGRSVKRKRGGAG